MASNINRNNQDNHLLGKIKDAMLALWSFLANCAKAICKFISQEWKTLVGFAAFLILIGGVIGIYNYYTNTYLPQKHLEEAVAGIEKKFHSPNDSIRYSCALGILNKYFSWGYEGVSDNEISSKLLFHQNEALKIIEDAAYAGDIDAQADLGDLYYFDDDYIKNDESKAAYWWNEAAQCGNYLTFNKVGLAYYNGIGVNKDLSLAIEWLKRGAEAGEMNAQFNYGLMFRDGVKVHSGSHITKVPQYAMDYLIGYERVTVQDSTVLVAKDIEMAKYWWKKAAAQGQRQAKEALQKIYN